MLVFNSAIICFNLFKVSISTSVLAKAEVSLLHRLSKGAYKKATLHLGCLCHKITATLHLGLSVPQDLITVYNSSVLVHLVRGFSILLMFGKVCSKYQEVPITFQKPQVRWLHRLSEGAYRGVVSSLGLVCATRSNHNLVC